MDIRVLVKRGKLQSLPQSMKLRLVNHTPYSKFNYPKTYLNGCNRRFKPEWVHNHSWLHYSASEDGVYCKACALFGRSEIKLQKLGSLVSKPFSLWTKQSSVCKKHEQLAYHQSFMTNMTAFKESCSNLTHNVASMLNTARKEQVSRNTKVIKSLLKYSIFCIC